MPNSSFADLVQVDTATTETGTLTLGSAITGYQDASALTDGSVYSYVIRDGSDFEVGQGTFAASGAALSRDLIDESSNGGAPLNLSGSATVTVGEAVARDLEAFADSDGGALEDPVLHGIVSIDKTTAADEGVIEQEGESFIHSYTDPDPTLQADTRNVFLGYQAGNFTMGPNGGVGVLGGRNVGIGYRALTSNTTGWQNTAVGHIALEDVTTGTYNTAVGAYALPEVTTGHGNTGIGADAGWKVTSGEFNTYVGTYSGQQTTTGSYNTALGGRSLVTNTTGTENIAIGYHTMLVSTVASFNVGVGAYALEDLTVGTGNVAIGRRALSNITEADGNVGVGINALQSLNGMAADNNVAVGGDALASATEAAGNTVVGKSAGAAVTTGDDNIFLGRNAGDNLTTGSRNIVIGSVDADSATANDQLNIAGVIKADLASGDVDVPGAFTVAGSALQPLDADLTALAANTANGFWARTGAGAGAARTITGTTNQITVANGSGSGGNPTLSLAPHIVTAGNANTGLGMTSTNSSSGNAAYTGFNFINDVAENNQIFALGSGNTFGGQFRPKALTFYSNNTAGFSFIHTGNQPWTVALNGAEVIRAAAGVFRPGADNAVTLGDGANRWSTVYAATGVINTSDARDKTTVRPMSEGEVAAAKALAAEIGFFRFLGAVQAKGEDKARWHAGMTVQRAMEIMQANGLNPLAYGFICHDDWGAQAALPEGYAPPVADNEGQAKGARVKISEPVAPRPAGDRYGFRPHELWMFIARGFEARLSALERAAA